MKTTFIDWVRHVFNRTGEAVPLSGDPFKDPEFRALMAGHYIRELAFEAAVNLIAKSISKCEFKTFVDGVETKGAEYYLWNIEPNRNQNSTAFIHKWIHQLLSENECLVVDVNGQLLVADSFQRKPFALYEDIFSEVTVGDFTFGQSFTSSDVLYFQLHQKNMRAVSAGIYESYRQLLEYTMKAYQRSRGNRGVLNISTTARGDPKFNEVLEEMMNKRFKKYFSADNAVLPLFEGWSYEDIGSKTYSSESTRDIRAMIDDVSDFTAKAFGIAPALLRGDVAGFKDALEMTLTFCVDPLADILQEEINRKRYGRAAYLAGNYLQIDTKVIKHVDLLSVSTAIDKLIGSGAFCINDIRRLVGETEIDEPWAREHWMTKNYAAANNAIEPVKVGGRNA